MRQWYDRSHFSFLVCNPQHEPQAYINCVKLPPTHSTTFSFQAYLSSIHKHKIKRDEYLFG